MADKSLGMRRLTSLLSFASVAAGAASPTRVRSTSPLQQYHENGRKALETEEIKVVEVLRVLPPDTAAAKYWLNNRHPDLWTEKPVVAVVQDQYVPPEDRPRTLAEIDAERKSDWSHFDLAAAKTENAKV